MLKGGGIPICRGAGLGMGREGVGEGGGHIIVIHVCQAPSSMAGIILLHNQ